MCLHLASRKPSPLHARTSAPAREHAELVAPPWAKVDRIALIHREIHESLSPGAIELLFAHGELVVEGSEAVAVERGSGLVYATIMMTIDLTRCASRVREPVDIATVDRLVELMHDHGSVRSKLIALARPDLARLARCTPDEVDLSVDITVRGEAMALLVDGDVVAWARNSRSG